MPVPATLADLSTTAGSNFPAGSESPNTSDDYLRAHAALIAELRDDKLDAAGPVMTAPVITAGPFRSFIEVSNPASGGSVTFGATSIHQVTSGTGTKAALTINLPTPAGNGHKVSFSCMGAITAVTVTPTGGVSVVGAPTTLAAGATMEFMYHATGTTWYRVG